MSGRICNVVPYFQNTAYANVGRRWQQAACVADVGVRGVLEDEREERGLRDVADAAAHSNTTLWPEATTMTSTTCQIAWKCAV